MYNLENEIDNIFFKYKLITYPEVIDKLIKDKDVNPINLEINLTNLCNHNCIWCTYNYLHNSNDTLRSEVVYKLIDSAYNMGIKSITWTGGGEPTVHKDFLNFIKYANKYGIKQGLNTNGVLLTDEIIDFIGNNFSYVRFSIDAGKKETLVKCHNAKDGDFDKIISNIKRMCNIKKNNNSDIVIGYSFLVDSNNIDDLLLAVKVASNLGVDYIQIKPIVNYYKDNKQFLKESKLFKDLRYVRHFGGCNYNQHILHKNQYYYNY